MLDQDARSTLAAASDEALAESRDELWQRIRIARSSAEEREAQRLLGEVLREQRRRADANRAG